MHYIIGLIGPSGSGKSALMLEAVKRLPDKIGILMSVTTRARRGPEDDLYYQIISREDYLRLRGAGQLATDTEYAGNFYGYKKDVVAESLKQGHLFCAVVESVGQQLIDGGYPTKLVRIHPVHQRVFRDEARLTADRARAKIKIRTDKEITNSFEPGGFDKAVQDLCGFVSSLS